MKNLSIPQGYQQVMPYLIVHNAANFCSFAKKVFNATEKMKIMRNETAIMHGELQIGESTIMFADSIEQFKPQPAGLFVYVQNADETYDMAITEGATSIMPMCDQEYGRSGGIADAFGNIWWITGVKNN